MGAEWLQLDKSPMPEYWGGGISNGNAMRVIDSFTRPSDTTAYAAGDVVGAAGAAGAVRRLASIGPVGGHLIINNVQLRMSGTAVPAGMGAGFRVHFHNAAPADAADNSAFSTAESERANYIGYIDVPTLELIGGGFLSRNVTFCGLQCQLQSNDLWYELVTQSGNAFTPTSASVIALVVRGIAVGLP